MRRVAIFVEGQSELIFIRNILFRLIDPAKLSFECITLQRYAKRGVLYPYTSPEPRVHFLIVNAGNDTSVVSAISERESNLFQRGFIEIIGLRDMYCQAYHKRSPGIIRKDLSRQFIDNHNNVIQRMSKPDHIHLFFSIMELEAWFLSMYGIFEKIEPTLTLEHIEGELGYNLREIDPQTAFYRPSNAIRDVLALCGERYTKSADEIERITQAIDIDDIRIGFENDRCQSLKDFYEKISEYQ